LRLLLEEDSMDAHLAQPMLSPDGSHLAIVTGDDGQPDVKILAMRAPMIVSATLDTTSDHPSWLPVTRPLADDAQTRPCPVVVVYPLD
jgi:hypothetical protein